jgi:penicillin-insensitive murein endopeptidase
MACPAGEIECKGQKPQTGGDGCNELSYWFSDAVLHPKPPTTPPKPHPPMTLAQMPAECRQVLAAPDAKP